MQQRANRFSRFSHGNDSRKNCSICFVKRFLFYRLRQEFSILPNYLHIFMSHSSLSWSFSRWQKRCKFYYFRREPNQEMAENWRDLKHCWCRGWYVVVVDRYVFECFMTSIEMSRAIYSIWTRHFQSHLHFRINSNLSECTNIILTKHKQLEKRMEMLKMRLQVPIIFNHYVNMCRPPQPSKVQNEHRTKRLHKSRKHTLPVRML